MRGAVEHQHPTDQQQQNLVDEKQESDEEGNPQRDGGPVVGVLPARSPQCRRGPYAVARLRAFVSNNRPSSIASSRQRVQRPMRSVALVTVAPLR
jgi:hypothetical protein